MEKLLERLEALEKRTNIMTFVRNGEICFMGKGLSEKKDLQAKIDKLEAENKELVEALGKMPCIGNYRSVEKDRLHGIKALCFKCTVLTKMKSEGQC